MDIWTGGTRLAKGFCEYGGLFVYGIDYILMLEDYLEF